MPDLMKAPTFTFIRECKAKLETKSVLAYFAASDGNIFEIDFAMQCLPLTITALFAEHGKLAVAFPDETQKQQPLDCIDARVSMNPKGEVALALRMSNQSELVIEFRKSDLAKLESTFSELSQLANRAKPH